MKPYFLVLLLASVLVCMVTTHAAAQSLAESDSVQVVTAKADSAFLQQIDSLLNQRLSKLDSLSRALKDSASFKVDSLASIATDETEQAIAQLKELISWKKVVVILLLFLMTYYFTVFIGKVLDNFSERISKYRLKIKRM